MLRKSHERLDLKLSEFSLGIGCNIETLTIVVRFINSNKVKHRIHRAIEWTEVTKWNIGSHRHIVECST